MDDNEINKPKLPSSAKFVPVNMNGTIRRINAGLYSLSFYLTKHYDALKTKLKRILATWILVTLVGFSYILSGKEVGIAVDKAFAAMFLAIFSSRIVLLMLYLESKIYHRLLNASFSTNLQMEKKGISSSHIHRNMMKSLLPEADPEIEKVYTRLSSKRNLALKKFLCWITKERGDPSRGLDPLFYDCAPFFIVCFVLWSSAGYFLFLYLGTPPWLEFHGLQLSHLIKPLSPIVSFLCCVYVIRKSLLSGFQRFKSARKKKFFER